MPACREKQDLTSCVHALELCPRWMIMVEGVGYDPGAPGMDDAANGAELDSALASIGLAAPSDLKPIARVLAAVLLLGNLSFEATTEISALPPSGLKCSKSIS